MSFKSAIVFIFFAAATLTLPAQIAIDNASFEGTPQDATLPQGWHACELGTTPDIMPGVWGVITEASDGDTYLGLITRTDGSFESIGQRLEAPLEKGMCYSFSMDLARSKTYAGYNFPVKLRIYAGAKKGKKKQLLYASPTISNEDWKTFDIKFTSKANYNYIIIEAHFADGLLFHYNGNILIDAITPLIPCVRA